MHELREACGLFAYYGFEVNPNAENIVIKGLAAQQHRGQESVGIASFEPNANLIKGPFKSMGLVRDFEKKSSFDSVNSSISIGHVLYSTTGNKKNLENVQPFIFYSDHLGCFTIAHNGQLCNFKNIKSNLQKDVPFQSTSDTELIAHLMTRSSEKSLEHALVAALKQIEGSYSLLVMSNNKLIAARDPMGNKPFSIAKFNLNKNFGGYCFASETCAFKYLRDLNFLDVEFERDINPGEVLVLSGNEEKSYYPFPERETAHCIFELIYFSSPGSRSFGVPVGKFRQELGRILALQDKVKHKDLLERCAIASVPDSGNFATTGYANETRIPIKSLLMKRQYGSVQRTFIIPDIDERFIKQQEKFEMIDGLYENDEDCVLVDDSIVRSNTSKNVIQMVKKYVSLVHFRTASPPIKYPCPLGIDFPTAGELGINKFGSVEKLKEYIGAETLEYLPLDRPDWVEEDIEVASLKELVNKFCQGKGFCYACFDGEYPCNVNNF